MTATADGATGRGPVVAVVAAAGSGERFGAPGPKAFVELAGRPMVGWSLEAFAAADSVDRVVVVAPAGSEAHVPSPRDAVVVGGATRPDSVRAGLRAAGDAEVVLVHDAARPLVSVQLIETLVAGLRADAELAGLIAAAPVVDTIKRAAPKVGDPRRIAGTVDRTGLWSAQTPQAFRVAPLRRALDAGAEGTDEAMALEQAGEPVGLHLNPEPNLKVTRPADLALAAALLAARAA
ncbi:MAG: 2-C-methyl-D-erythritol 4-phosphate cytidylyltransferase [Solirubrobacterales bacterium]